MADPAADADGPAPGRSGGVRTAVRRNPVPSLLESLGRDHLDPGYAEAARRKAERAAGSSAPPRSGNRRQAIAAVALACLVVGLLFGIAASTTESNQPRAEKTRSALLGDIDRAQQRQSELASAAQSLADELRATQSVLGAAGPLETVANLEKAGQITPVTGPGLRVILDEAPADSTSAPAGGVILDRDVQLLVNDLWAAGAEAIAIGGVRLQPRSAIRQAGGSILVDNKPVFWPITIDAIGDPSGLQVELIGSPGYGRFSTFSQLYGIEFDVSAQEEMSLPGGSNPDLRYARPPVDEAAPSAAAPTPTVTSSAGSTLPPTTTPQTTTPPSTSAPSTSAPATG